jgi:hypothetical protein
MNLGGEGEEGGARRGGGRQGSAKPAWGDRAAAAGAST